MYGRSSNSLYCRSTPHRICNGRGPDRETRGVLVFGTGFRNVAAALVVITATFSDPGNKVLLMVLMVTIFSVIIVSTIVGIILNKRMKVEKISRGG